MFDDYCHLMINSNLVEGAIDQGHDVHDTIFLTHINVQKKIGEKSLTAQLPGALCFIQASLFAGRSVCISCDTGNDIGAVVALAALQSFFDEDGQLITGEIPIHSRGKATCVVCTFETFTNHTSGQAEPQDEVAMDHIE